ncbi:MAG: KOW domain-containing RNA-binding protein [Eubacteriales bacterium]|nr:KOW domain-containing RNA-binding protein [Eubacteriales bacterium]
MKADPREIGRVVISKQGHDKGKAYVVTAVLDERYVLLCDGAARRLEKPKKKQAKHLRALPQLVEEIAGALEAKQPLSDSDIRKALKNAQALQDRPARGEANKEVCAFVQE